MDMTEIKMEYNNYDNICLVCLSVGRKLSPLQQHKDVFQLITSQLEFQSNLSLDNVLLCWECHAILRKIYLFQVRVRRAKEILLMGQNYLLGTISQLNTVILNDVHQTVYVNDINIQTAIDNDDSDDVIGDHSENCDKSDIVKDENILKESKEKKKTKNNRWAKQRALINKEPKFRIITDNTQKAGNTFKRIQINNNEELILSMANEKNGEFFKSKKFKCFNCVLIFENEKYLERHNKKYHCDVGTYICDICCTKTSKKRHLVTHIKKHYYKYQCSLCEFSSFNKNQCLIHYKKRHKNVFECVNCGLRFGSRKAFFKHYKEWHEKYICDICGIHFKMRYCIEDHIRKQHSPFECKPCGKRFARYNGLWLHNKIAHGTHAAAYCVECDKRYPDIYRYRWHLSNSAAHSTTQKVRVPCPGCDKIFSKKIYMKDHYNLVHLKHYKYRCEKCDKNFIRNADLVKHSRRVHEGIRPARDKMCYLCGRGFSTNKILAGHVRTHSNEKRNIKGSDRPLLTSGD